MDLKKKYATAINKHIHLGSPLPRKLIAEILATYPDLAFQGKAYRVLSFSQNHPAQDIREDLSFSSSMLAVSKFGTNLDHEFIHLYEANVKGLDLMLVSEVLGFCSSGETIGSEQEVIALEVYEVSLVFSGTKDEFWKKYARGL